MLHRLSSTERRDRSEARNGNSHAPGTRSRISLDGRWNFWTDPDDSLSLSFLPADHCTQITVPAPWQTQSPDLNFYTGVAWYQRTLEIPEKWLENGAVILGFDAADYSTEVWLNGKRVGEHEGGYLPFELDVTHTVLPGENILTVKVDDPARLFPEIPHGKQGWYGPLSGLWQSVWLEHRSELHICKIMINADLDQGCMEAQVSLSGPAETFHQIVAKVIGPHGELCAYSQVAVTPQAQGANFTVTVTYPLPWSPETPNLYHLEVQLEKESGVVDRQSKHFGFRKIETRDGKVYLNGQLLYLRGALDQDYYLDTIYTSPNITLLEDQIRKAKEMGLNCLRCHIKVADQRYYDVADRLGMLIWTELPNWSVFTETAGQRGRETLMGILERDGHHPSIIIWTIINENWGMDLVNDESHRAWLKDTYRWLKALDPNRLVVDNSPCVPNFHIQTDLEDYHFYRAIPDQRKEWDRFVREFASRADWTFSDNGDIIRTYQEPLIVSEFGNWGLPDVDLLLNEKGQDPWWFETGFEWSQGVVYPEGVRNRFHSLGLQWVFGSLNKFVEATQWQQYLALKYEIEAMRRHPEICGYVITEMTDVHWECNGLMDMRRNPKVFHEEFKKINADTVILPKWKRVVYWSGEKVKIEISISHSAGENLPGGEIHWNLSSNSATGKLTVPTVQSGQVLELGTLTFPAPELQEPAVQRLTLKLFSPEGQCLATNHLDLSFHPRNHFPGGAEAAVNQFALIWTDDKKLANRLQKLGYRITDDLGDAELAITGQVSETLLAYVRNGGRLLILADRVRRSGQLIPGIHLQPRRRTPWLGDWASAFSWLKRKGPFARIPGGPLIDHSFDRVIPKWVLVGFKDWEFRSLVQAGLVVGWVHKPAVLIGERFYGKGKAVLNTFHLENAAIGSDPTATALLQALIEQARC